MTGSRSALEELDSRAQWRVYWGFLWRQFVLTLGAMLCGAVAGFILGFIGGLFAVATGHDASSPAFMTTMRVLGATAGVAVGLWLYWHWLKWIFRSSIGGFRLQLVAAGGPAVPAADALGGTQP